jgi:hypothetical protein
MIGHNVPWVAALRISVVGPNVRGRRGGGCGRRDGGHGRRCGGADRVIAGVAGAGNRRGMSNSATIDLGSKGANAGSLRDTFLGWAWRPVTVDVVLRRIHSIKQRQAQGSLGHLINNQPAARRN